MFEIEAVGPNPASDHASVTLTSAAAGDVRVEVYDVLGRLTGVAFDGRVVVGSNTLSVPVGALPPGTYVVRVRVQGGTAASRVFSIVR